MREHNIQNALLARLLDLPVIRQQLDKDAEGLTTARAALIRERAKAREEGGAKHAQLRAELAAAVHKREAAERALSQALADEIRIVGATSAEVNRTQRACDVINERLRHTAAAAMQAIAGLQHDLRGVHSSLRATPPPVRTETITVQTRIGPQKQHVAVADLGALAAQLRELVEAGRDLEDLMLNEPDLAKIATTLAQIRERFGLPPAATEAAA